MREKIILGTLVIIIVIVIGTVMWSNKKMKDIEQNQQILDNNSMGLIVGKNALNVNDQKPGILANISLVILEDKGYVVIHEITDGKPGKIIGSSALLNRGESKNISVELFNTLKEGKSYMAMLHIDNGDGLFEASLDNTAINDEVSKDIIMMEFQVSANANSDNGISI